MDIEKLSVKLDDELFLKFRFYTHDLISSDSVSFIFKINRSQLHNINFRIDEHLDYELKFTFSRWEINKFIADPVPLYFYEQILEKLVPALFDYLNYPDSVLVYSMNSGDKLEIISMVVPDFFKEVYKCLAYFLNKRFRS